MSTTIKTTSRNQFEKILTYINNKRIFFTTNFENGIYSLTLFNLESFETNSLIQKMTKHFHLTKQQEPLALVA